MFRQRDRAQGQVHPPDLDLRQPGLAPHEHHRHGLVHGRALGDDRGDGLGELAVPHVHPYAQAVEAGAGVGGGEAHEPLLVQVQDAVGHPGRAVPQDRPGASLDRKSVV